jgi:hypothetical protein
MKNIARKYFKSFYLLNCFTEHIADNITLQTSFIKVTVWEAPDLEEPLTDVKSQFKFKQII